MKALAHPTRLRILEVLADKQGFGLEQDSCCAKQEVCVCKLNDLFDISPPTLSHHLKLLRQAGVIEGRRDGVWIYYSISPGLFTRLAVLLQRLEPEPR